MKTTRLLLIVIALSWSCSDERHVVQQKPGYFVLSYLKTPDKGGRSAYVMANPEREFNLGDIKASREFYFMLGNGTHNPITDVTLAADNEKVVISPASISSLSGDGNDFLPLISVSVVHGVQLNGVGFTDILEMGPHEILLTIKGKTTENGAVLNLESTFKLIVNAKVMDIDLMDGGTLVDLTTVTVGASGVFDAGGLGLVPGYHFNGETVKIKNTGNVSISVTLQSFLPGVAPMFAQVAQGETINLILPTSTDPLYPGKLAMITLDGNGTITSYDRIKLGNDGRGYMIIE